MTISIIVAIDEDNGIGKNGNIPWFYSEDMKFFAKITKGSTCIMGRITYESILAKMGERKDLLPGRQNLVVSRNEELVPVGASLCKSVREAVYRATRDDVFIIGGGGIYLEALPFARNVYITRIPGKFNCDVRIGSVIDAVNREFTLKSTTISESLLEYWHYKRIN